MDTKSAPKDMQQQQQQPTSQPHRGGGGLLSRMSLDSAASDARRGSLDSGASMSGSLSSSLPADGPSSFMSRLMAGRRDQQQHAKPHKVWTAPTATEDAAMSVFSA